MKPIQYPPTGRMPTCGGCTRGVPDEVRVTPTKAERRSGWIKDADYHPECLERVRAMAAHNQRMRRLGL